MSSFTIVILGFVKLRTAIAQLPKQSGRVDPDVFHVRPYAVSLFVRLIKNIARGFVHDGLKISVTATSIGFGARAYE